MKKFIVMLIFVLSLCLCGCSSVSSENVNVSEPVIESPKETEIYLPVVEKEENLFDVEMTISADYTDAEMKQEDYDELAKAKGYKSIILNEDNSVTYTMTKKQHKEFVEEIRIEVCNSIDSLIESEQFPNFTEIKYNDDFTEIEVTTKSKELDFAESFSTLYFYSACGMYNQFAGNTIENCHIDFINAETGEIIDSANLAD